MLVQLSIVYNYRTIRHAMTKNDVISEKVHFHFLGEYAKLDRMKTMGTRGTRHLMKY